MEKISVIVPVYRVEPYLRRCVESVAAQTYGNLEIILVDDGSPDGCPRLCDLFSRADPRIRVIHRENGGLSAARNTGIDRSTGEWLMFVDGDDFIAPEMAERLYETARRYGADMVYCTVNAFTEDEKGYREYRLWASPPGAGIPMTGDALLRSAAETRQGLLSGHHVISCNKLYRRSLFRGLRYPEGQVHEDEAVAHRILGGCGTVVGINEGLYYYRQRPDSIMGAGEDLFRRISMALAYGDRILYFAERNLSEPIGQVYYRYWTGLISGYSHIGKDRRCRRLIPGLRSQMRRVEKLYRVRREVPLSRKAGVFVFCRFPKPVSVLFSLSVRLRNPLFS